MFVHQLFLFVHLCLALCLCFPLLLLSTRSIQKEKKLINVGKRALLVVVIKSFHCFLLFVCGVCDLYVT